jgi:hypothetical protein
MRKTKQQAAVFMKSPNAMKAACEVFLCSEAWRDEIKAAWI